MRCNCQRHVPLRPKIPPPTRMKLSHPATGGQNPDTELVVASARIRIHVQHTHPARKREGESQRFVTYTAYTGSRISAIPITMSRRFRRVSRTVSLGVLALLSCNFNGSNDNNINNSGHRSSSFILSAHAQPCSPNHCSGHGSCESSTDGSTSARQCSCNSGWTGADCSLMICPTGAAWADKATGTDDAHASMECSNRGTCDRNAGICR